MKKRLLAVLLSVAMCMSITTGCGASKETSAEGTEESTEVKETKVKAGNGKYNQAFVNFQAREDDQLIKTDKDFDKLFESEADMSQGGTPVAMIVDTVNQDPSLGWIGSFVKSKDGKNSGLSRVVQMQVPDDVDLLMLDKGSTLIIHGMYTDSYSDTSDGEEINVIKVAVAYFAYPGDTDGVCVNGTDYDAPKRAQELSAAIEAGRTDFSQLKITTDVPSHYLVTDVYKDCFPNSGAEDWYRYALKNNIDINSNAIYVNNDTGDKISISYDRNTGEVYLAFKNRSIILESIDNDEAVKVSKEISLATDGNGIFFYDYDYPEDCGYYYPEGETDPILPDLSEITVPSYKDTDSYNGEFDNVQTDGNGNFWTEGEESGTDYVDGYDPESPENEDYPCGEDFDYSNVG